MAVQQQRQNAFEIACQLKDELRHSLPEEEVYDPHAPPAQQQLIRELQRNCSNYIAHTVDKRGRELWPLLHSIVFTDLDDVNRCASEFGSWLTVLVQTIDIQTDATQYLQLVTRKQFSAHFALHNFIYMLRKVCIKCLLQLTQLADIRATADHAPVNHAQNDQRQVAFDQAQQFITRVSDALPPYQKFQPTAAGATRQYNDQRISIQNIVELFQRERERVWPLLDGVQFVELNDLDSATIVLRVWTNLINSATDTLHSMEDRLCLVVQKRFEALSEMQEFINQLCFVIARIVSGVGALAPKAGPNDVLDDGKGALAPED